MRITSVLSGLLKPSPSADPILDPSQIDKNYKYWRIRTFYSIYFGYVIFYFTRKSYTFAMPVMMDEMGMSSADLGFLGSILYITYGFSKFFSGILADRSNPRFFMSIGLILTGIWNIFFGFSSSLLLLGLLWGLNGWFQGFGWPACTKQLTYWFSQSERGLWWSVVSTSHNVGGAIIPLIAASCASAWGWQWAMWVPGLIAICGGIWLMERMRDVPTSLGLPPVEIYKKEPSDSSENSSSSSSEQQKTAEMPLPVSQILFNNVLSNKAVWILAFSYFFVYIIRTAINDWGTVYLVKEKGYPVVTAASAVMWFEVGGFLGTLAAGYFSDKFFQGRRIPYMCLCGFLLIACIFVFGFVPIHSVLLDSVLMGTIGFLIFGPQLLVGLAASEFVDKKAACTANGFAGCFAYLGAAATGYPLGSIIDRWSWGGFFYTNLICVVIMTLLLLPMWSKSSRVSSSDQEEAEDLKDSIMTVQESASCN